MLSGMRAVLAAANGRGSFNPEPGTAAKSGGARLGVKRLDCVREIYNSSHAVATRTEIQYLHGMSWNTLLGHSREIDKPRISAASNRLAHAYAFVGSSGIGKKRFALELARFLLCDNHADADLAACGQCSSCQQVDARTHPDLLTVSLPEGKSELPIKLFIGEDESRGKEGLCHDLSLKPMSARRRVAIIDDA